MRSACADATQLVAFVFGIRPRAPRVSCSYQHNAVKLIDFSPDERYLVTWNPLDPGRPDAENLIVWETRTGKRLRGFAHDPRDEHGAPVAIQWPVFKWNHNGEYLARAGTKPGEHDSIMVYQTPSMKLLDKKSIKVMASGRPGRLWLDLFASHTPVPHLHRDWAHRCHICTGTGLTPATSAPGLGSPLPHLHRDWARSCPHLRRDWAHPCHICTGTGLTPPTSAPGLQVAGMTEFCWSPKDDVISIVVPEADNNPARVVLMDIPSRYGVSPVPV